ncbi:hypothetical protein [Saccharopolyspora sp. ASAGF58]|nr:hypothetical protein [Saccharopolyspora sp. ASAGF58]
MRISQYDTNVTTGTMSRIGAYQARLILEASKALRSSLRTPPLSSLR